MDNSSTYKPENGNIQQEIKKASKVHIMKKSRHGDQKFTGSNNFKKVIFMLWRDQVNWSQRIGHLIGQDGRCRFGWKFQWNDNDKILQLAERKKNVYKQRNKEVSETGKLKIL